MRSWWREQWMPVVVVAVLLPVLVFVLLGVPLIDRGASTAPVTRVPHAETVELAGYDFTLDLNKEFPGEGRTVATDLALVAAIIEITPGDAADVDASCTVQLVDGDRAWPALSNPADYEYRIDDNSERYCVLDGDAMELEVVFLVPEGAYADASVEITVTGSSAVTVFELR